MAQQIITCPSCKSRYQTKEAGGRRLKCPQCGTTLEIPVQPIESSDPLSSLESSEFSTDLPTGLDAGLGQTGLPSGEFSKQRRARKEPGFSLDPRLTPFLRRLGLGVGGVCLLIVLAGAVGWFSEPIGMAAVVLGGVAMIGLALAGTIWLVVIGFRESVGLGIASIFVPFIWIHFLVKRIGRSQLAFAVVLSSLMPALVTLGVISLLATRHSPEGRSATRATSLAKKADQFAETIHQTESQATPTDEARDATFSSMDKIDDPSTFVSQGNQALSQFAHYVEGSLTVDQGQQTISFQHRGTNQLESQYRLYLAAKTSVLLHPKPK